MEKPKVDESLLLKASLSDYAMLKVLVIVCGTDGDKRHSNGSRWLELRHDFLSVFAEKHLNDSNKTNFSNELLHRLFALLRRN